ncbi:MAG TPA: fused MFS/spermidine synthase [Gemmatimonadaceae bacterium]
MLFALYALFFLSGAAGLMYESIWTRYLALLVGHSAYAQILVLTIFLGGMAVGSFVVGRYSKRLRRPLLWYALVEIAVGVLGLLFHPTFRAVSAAAYDSLFPALVSSPGAQSTIKWLLAALLILPQSILLGATFPLISAGILRRWTLRPGAVLSWLYASNSFGAAVGVLLAGFYLVNRFDFPGTLMVAAELNFLAAAITLVIVRQSKVGPAPSARADFERLEITPPGPASLRQMQWLLLGAAFGTAVASFAYEIAWIRMLSLVLGSATHSFELMLSAFILGLALGALWVSRHADQWNDPLRALGLVQCAMGALAVATLPLYMQSFTWISKLLDVFHKTSAGYAGFTIARYGICLAVMLPATFCAGMTLPLITRILYRGGANEAAIGEVYAANTAGSIVGVQLAGLVLLPLIGVKFLVVAGGVLDAAIGLVLLYVAIPRTEASRTRILATLAIASVVVFLGASSVRFDRSLLASGVYRFGGLPTADEFRMLFYKDGRTSTVNVKRASDVLILSTNGKPDASVAVDWLAPDPLRKKRRSLVDDVSTQVLLPLIAIAHAPQAKSAAVIGQGSGMTSHLLLGSPTLRRLATIEIEPEMIRASTWFRAVNHRVFSDDRSHFVIDDARSYFAGAGQRFDLIVSEPSNPWVSGVAGLFTTEFYARIKQYLAPGGVFAQWMHLYEMNDWLVLTMLAAVQQNFPAYDIYLTDDTDIVVIATNAASVRTPDWRVTEWPMVAEDLRNVAGLTAASLAALHLADSKVLSPLVAKVRPNSDFAPVLDLSAEKSRYMLTDAAGFEHFNTTSFDIAAALSGRRLPLATDTEVLANVPALYMRAWSARIRLFPHDSTPADSTYVVIARRRRSFNSAILTGEAPSDWQRWVAQLFDVDRDVHDGSPGSIDTSLYRQVDGFLSRTSPPAGVRQSVEFLKAADAWNFPVVQRVGDELIERIRSGEKWFSPDYLRDATVVAHLKNGDPVGALSALNAMSTLVSRDAIGFLRTQLLRGATSQLIAQRREGAAP